jgi:hypothetical protein
MMVTRRNMIWSLVIVTVGCVWLLMVAGAFPDAVDDIFVRSWPVLLVLFGADVLVSQRRLRFGRFRVSLWLLSLVVILAGLVAVIWSAYQKQADVYRDENIVTLAETVPDDVVRLRVEIAVDRVDIVIAPFDDASPRSVAADFAGSNESDVEMQWQIEGDSARLVVGEAQSSRIPKLEDYGRGTLRVMLPTEVGVEQFVVSSTSGQWDVDLLTLRVDRIEYSAGEGNLRVVLPAQDTLTGELRIDEGDLELSVAETRALELKAQGGREPRYEYDTFRYDLLRDGPLKRKNVDAFDIILDVYMRGDAKLTVIDLEY